MCVLIFSDIPASCQAALLPNPDGDGNDTAPSKRQNAEQIIAAQAGTELPSLQVLQMMPEKEKKSLRGPRNSTHSRPEDSTRKKND